MAAVNRVLLLNPPWRAPILRDAYCTSVSKAGYLWPPVDLLAQTGHLHAAGFEVDLVDAIAARTSRAACLDRIARFDPAAVVLLSSPLSERDDDAIARELPGRTVIVSGEAASAHPAAYLAARPWVAAVLTDYTADSVALLLRGARGALPALWRREGGCVVPGFAAEGPVRLPPPRHDLLDLDAYRMPLSGGGRVGTLLTDFGCARRCRYCNSGSFGHRLRDPPELEPELDVLERLAVRHLLVKDMSFGAVPAHALAVCARLARRRMTWRAYVRADDVTPSLAAAMSSSGCRLVQIGLESGAPRLRREYGKDVDDAVFEKAVGLCRAHGMGVGLHLVLGLPGEDASTLRATRRLVARLRPDYVSANVATIRSGSAAERGAPRGLGPVPAGILWARARLYLDLHLRPAWIRAALRTAGTARARASLARSGWTLARGLLGARRERRWLDELRRPRAGAA
ncbi:MAG TPA: B12-binding domain-containing radical SAM protein, partial [Anaeromyxobacter sp.]|nr:B12-binding domain-containing radical SAM protein [Anaeromyxobacter sp.]